jgi:hypothetical protein
MSDSARHAAYLVPETVYGETPAEPAFSRLRHTALTIGVQRGSLQSDELRPDRQIAHFRLGAVSVAGDVKAELSFGTFDEILEAVLCGTWTGNVLKAGTVRRSFSLLRHFTDIAAAGEGKPFHLFKGVEFNSLALTVAPTAIVGVTFGLIGREGADPANAGPVDATYGAPSTSEPLDAFSGELTVNGVASAIVTEISLNVENGLAPRNVVGSKLTIRPTIGRSNLTGSATFFFEDAATLSKFLTEANVALSFELPDGLGNSYTFTIPKLIFTGGQPDTSGQGAITLTMPFQGVYDDATESNIVVTRVID